MGRPAAQEIPTQLALLALGFLGPEHGRLLADLGAQLDQRGHVARDENFTTSQDSIFMAGDISRGQPLIVWQSLRAAPPEGSMPT